MALDPASYCIWPCVRKCVCTPISRLTEYASCRVPGGHCRRTHFTTDLWVHLKGGCRDKGCGRSKSKGRGRFEGGGGEEEGGGGSSGRKEAGGSGGSSKREGGGGGGSEEGDGGVGGGGARRKGWYVWGGGGVTLWEVGRAYVAVCDSLCFCLSLCACPSSSRSLSLSLTHKHKHAHTTHAHTRRTYRPIKTHKSLSSFCLSLSLT
jgi:hypothetical protein